MGKRYSQQSNGRPLSADQASSQPPQSPSSLPTSAKVTASNSRKTFIERHLQFLRRPFGGNQGVLGAGGEAPQLQRLPDESTHTMS